MSTDYDRLHPFAGYDQWLAQEPPRDAREEPRIWATCTEGHGAPFLQSDWIWEQESDCTYAYVVCPCCGNHIEMFFKQER